MSKSKRVALAPALALLLALGCASSRMTAPRMPPEAQRERETAKPGGGYFWVPGHWEWSEATGDFFWVKGRWESERKNRVLVPGTWTKQGDRWVFDGEHWESTRE